MAKRPDLSSLPWTDLLSPGSLGSDSRNPPQQGSAGYQSYFLDPGGFKQSTEMVMWFKQSTEMVMGFKQSTEMVMGFYIKKGGRVCEVVKKEQ